MTESYVGSSSQSGGFFYTSPLASASHDPLISLSSHCIRDAFGPSVQLVADALQTRGHPISLGALVAYMNRKCPMPQRRLGIPAGVQPTDPDVVRAALLTLVQHGIVSVSFQKRMNGTSTLMPSMPVYTYHGKIARNLMRFAKYIEFIRRGVDEASAFVLQIILVAGNLQTTDWISRALAQSESDHQNASLHQVVDSVHKLVTQGYVIRAKRLQMDVDEEEYEFETGPPLKRARLNAPMCIDDDKNTYAILETLNGNTSYNTALPVDAVWKVNFAMFHDQLSAFMFGRLVSERFGSVVQYCGSLVTAALRFRAHQKHVVAPLHGIAFEASNDLMTFQATDCITYIPTAVLQQMEKKAGGLKANMRRAWDEIVERTHHPAVVRRSSDGTRLEINFPSLLRYLQERAVHQLVLDRHGEIAARIISILLKSKWLESDSLTDQAMIPAKDTREICHRLYRSRYVEILQLGTARQHNPAHAIYLWGVDPRNLRQRCSEDVATALWNVRLRRQHQIEAGRHWLERERFQKDSEVAADENIGEADRIHLDKFKLGLERLDVAALHLDDTLMVLNDYTSF
ncbi:hypothetical protein MPSEU_000377500 [Mayamaea pseudoterrestris]|nr:hypothetical protein MPSEU_000377500 [Mayamaea pseudoterrestris]